ncbi:hypothetical protein [Haloarchaeobius amylolyticus]|uniref:Nmad3 family putative nucleotide modification protein n=1 Tax=Haloarchaeobius amylolyticus TaxID=1198296 RepID=UPI00226EFCDF|nr:hypothetical protein [Haloarchaeobius amylolyticus]
MTVVLIGVGADQSNSSPYPQIYDDGSFEYVPIPEAYPSSETNTFGTISRKSEVGHLQKTTRSEDTLADVLDEIKPRESKGDTIRGADINSHQIHWDPNFSKFTYGEVKTANKNQIRQLDPEQNDVLAFYTGLATPDSGTPHRYIIGYFTVNDIVDFEPLLGENPPTNDDGRVIVSELDSDTRDVVESHLSTHSKNSHAKRYSESGTIHPNLMIVDGGAPGELLGRGYNISHTVPGGHAFTEDVEEQLRVVSTASHRETGFLGGFKKAHRLDLSGQEFIDIVTERPRY